MDTDYLKKLELNNTNKIMQKLFTEFTPTTTAQWKDQLVKDLKGIDYNTLVWKTNSGIEIQPFYTKENLSSDYKPLFTHTDWDICEHIVVTDEKKANEQALKALKGGASGLVFYIHQKINTATLIKDISLEHIYSQFFISHEALQVLEDLKPKSSKTNPHDGKQKCFVTIDPLCFYVFNGGWQNSQETDLSILKELSHIPVNLGIYQEAGANTINELAIALSHLNENLNYLNNNQSLKNQTLHLSVSIGSDFFMEIAKLRAYRKLIAMVFKEYNISFPIHIHAQTTQLNTSSLDAYNNMLRTTTEGMSAVIGGCNSLNILPFDIGFEEATDFSSRIARNQQHILKEESYLNKSSDISAGSYYIETLTDTIAEKAWEQFKIIESKGGFMACLKINFIQDLISKDAEILMDQVKEGKIVLVGVNKFQNAKEEVKLKPIQQINEKKTEIKKITPIRLAKSFEKQSAQTASNY